MHQRTLFYEMALSMYWTAFRNNRANLNLGRQTLQKFIEADSGVAHSREIGLLSTTSATSYDRVSSRAIIPESVAPSRQ